MRRVFSSEPMPSTKKKKKKPPSPRPLQYKVVELSTVDEGTLERTINDWVGRDWHLDGIQFAMREASKRPAMAFLLFTRTPSAELEEPRERSLQPSQRPVSLVSSGADRALERLRQLAEDEPLPRKDE
jgi:hypothetical protein